MRSIITIALILTALSLQAQVVPNATNADSLGGTPATDYMTIGAAVNDFLPKSTGPVIEQNLAEITQIKIDTSTIQSAVDLLEENTGYLQTATELLETNTGYLQTATELLGDNTGYLEATDGLIADATKQNKVEIDDNKTVIEELSSTTEKFFYTNELSPSDEYLLMISTPPVAAESTIVSTLDSATVIVASFTVESPLTLDRLRAGLYHLHFHAEVDNASKSTRIRAEVYKGTGAANTFLFSTAQSNIITTDKAVYDTHISTNEILGNPGFLNVRIVADVTGGGPNPVLTFYMEGDNESNFEMPVLASDVSVIKIIAGINTNPTPSNGRGEVAVNVDTMSFVLESLQFNPEPSEQSHSEGKVFYDNAEKALSYYNDEADIALQIGQEEWARVRNESGQLIIDGSVVYFSGATGQIPTIEEALANDMITCRVIGVATHDIENNSFGYVTTFGIVRNIDTSTGGLSDGDIVYVSPTSTGSFTNVKPSDPDCAVVVGYIAYSHGSNGKLFVRPSDPLGISDILNLQTRLDLIKDATQQNKVEIDQNVTDITTLAVSTGTVNRPYTLVVGFTKDCDYICDGSADDVQINLATTQLATLGTGGVVMLREGIYDLNARVQTQISSTTIMGQGAGTILIPDSGDGIGIYLNHEFCRVENLSMRLRTASPDELIQVNKDNCIIQNCNLESQYAANEDLINVTTNGNGCMIIDCRIMDFGNTASYGMTISGDNSKLSNNIIRMNWGANGVLITGNGIMIDNNKFSGTIGLTLSAVASTTTITNNDFNDCSSDDIAGVGINTNARSNIAKGGGWLPELEFELINGATIAGQLKVKQITSGDAGSAGDVYTRFASSDSWAEAAAGGGAGGNKNREYRFPAKGFVFPATLFAQPYKAEFNITGSTYAFYGAQFDETDDEHFNEEVGMWDAEYDDGNITAYVLYYTTYADAGRVEFNVGVSTAMEVNSTLPFTNKVFGLFNGSPTAYKLMIATLTITANKPVDDAIYKQDWWVDGSDSTVTGEINVKEFKIKYTVD